MFREKFSIAELVSKTERYTEEYRPRVCNSFQELLEWYSTRFDCSYQSAFSMLIHLGVTNFHNTHTGMFDEHIQALNTMKYDPTCQNTDDAIDRRVRYMQIGNSITFLISQIWPHTQHDFRPHVLLVESSAPKIQRMRRLYGIDSCTVLKLYVAYAFVDAFEDIPLYNDIRKRIDKELGRK